MQSYAPGRLDTNGGGECEEGAGFHALPGGGGHDECLSGGQGGGHLAHAETGCGHAAGGAAER